jgi:DNA repair ATPase RecN
MNFRFIRLYALCKDYVEEIAFSSNITVFHGKISSGKSSILRSIDYCFGGKIEKTPAILSELVTVRLLLQIGENKVELRRSIDNEGFVEVTWSNQEESHVLSAPIKPSQKQEPIYAENVYCLSDLLFYLSGIDPIFVPKSKQQKEITTVRLSFRDILKFCYLDQDELDSSFYDLKTPMILSKSQNAMRFILGFYTERISELKHDLSNNSKKLEELNTSLRERKKFLSSSEIGSAAQIKKKIKSEQSNLQQAEKSLKSLRNDYTASTHVHDELRETVKEIRDRVQKQRRTCDDLAEAIKDQESLQSEFVTTKMKHSRFIDSSIVLSKVSFERCPICGQNLVSKDVPDHCSLCGNKIETETKSLPEAEMLKVDLEERISELSESLQRRKKILAREKTLLDTIVAERDELDEKLDQSLEEYDSRYLSSMLELQKQVTTYSERVKNLRTYEKMYDSIKDLEKQTTSLRLKIKEIRTEIKEEESGIEIANLRKKELEEKYIDILNEANVPGVTRNDTISLDMNSWIPSIHSEGKEDVKWNFYSAGSAGKKTLLNTCYALALHSICRKHNLHLPSFIVIDTPMKNIGEDVNKSIFRSFYSVLYSLASKELFSTQFLIVDKEYLPPESELNLDVSERYMTPDDKDNPPFLSEYRGP